ncbi:hypothetical protein ACJIZ3_005200 [Penstemon smallii]|uniref:Coilin n=1 Tax=Penstemon smallii TaxID=265156 RepID=A0ABD3S4G6_9LAMI
MDESKRVRVVFKDDDILNEAQKSEGLNRSWLLLKPQQQHATISDVESHLLHAFQLHNSCPNGLLLTISGFVVPPFESTCILKDNEVIRVRKKRNILHLEGRNAANELEKLEAVVEQQPAKTGGVLLLANEEFVKEKGGYESEEESEDDLLEDVENPLGRNADSKNRKRKAAEKIRGSKKKKQRCEAPGVDDNDVPTNSSKGGVLKKRKLISQKEKETDSSSEDDVENKEESSKLSDKSDLPVHETKRNAEVQYNGKETEGAKETKKVPSRSARRKYAKRRWMREMANIQKKNAVCESEGLRNWKEDHAKVDRSDGGQVKRPQKWKKQATAERTEEDGQPKGLLHWKQSPQNNPLVKGKKRQQRNQNVYFHKLTNQNGDGAEQPNQRDNGHEWSNQNADGHEQANQNDDIHKQPNEKNVDVQEQTNQKNGNAQEQFNQNGHASEQSNKESDEENEVVPIVIRPGHIRFEPLEKEQTVQQKHVPMDNFQWNGITSKKKGQKWGSENYSFSSGNDHKNQDKDHSESDKKEKQLHRVIDFDKLPPLPSMPKEGDLIAYRVLELSSSWTPELSDYRVGKVSWYDPKSDQTLLVAVSEYPIVSKKTDEDEDLLLYKEDGSLQIDFLSLIDVRIINGASSWVSEVPVGKENAPKTVSPSTNDEQTVISSSEFGELIQGKETQPSTAENGGADIWDQISEALSAKKEELSTNNNWGKSPKKVQVSQNAIIVRPPPANSWGKNTKKVQPSQETSWGKQNSGGRTWKRGSALGPTMAILRSNKDI